MSNDKEVRVAGLELRGEDDAPRRMVGYAAVFDTATDIGGMFREQIAPGAFTDAIRNDDVRALIDHDSTLVLGRNRAGTLRLSQDEKGLRVEIDPPDTQPANDLVSLMRRGDVDQMSFGFIVQREEWDDTQTPPLRTIKQASLRDVSVVTFPAYPTTEIALRSLDGARAPRIDPRSRMRRKLELAERGEMTGKRTPAPVEPAASRP